MTKESVFSSKDNMERSIKRRGFQNIPYRVEPTTKMIRRRELPAWKPVFYAYDAADAEYIRSKGYAAEVDPSKHDNLPDRNKD